MRHTNAFYLCAVDGGGTSCRAALARADGTILAQTLGHAANYSLNPEGAIKNVQRVVQQALTAVPSDTVPPNRLIVHVGIAGIMNEADAAAARKTLGFEFCDVSDDRLTTLVGALGERQGAVMALGTGSFVAARGAGGIRYFGGWGYYVGDQASGAWLGRASLEHTLLAWDEVAPESDLTRALLSRFAGTPSDIVAFAKKATPGDFASLAPLVLEAAKAGDAVGCEIMERGAAYLHAVLNAAGVAGDDVVCLTGGVGAHYEPFLADAVRQRIKPPNGTALDGGLRLARKRLEEKGLHP